jgi:acylglycerol lipase
MRTPLETPDLRTWRMRDRYELHGRIWPGAGRDTDAIIFYLHGIQSHGGWFEWSASLLAGSGRPVILPDRRGSGLNQDARGDTPSFERLLDDLDELAAAANAEFGPKPIAVVGVSWGGKLAVAWAVRRPAHVVRLLLVAPGLFPAVDVGLLRRLQIGAALLRRPTRLLSIPLDDPALFTDNPAGRDFIARDPLKLSHATARFLYESARLDHLLARIKPGALRADVTLLLAGRERIVRNPPTERWLRRVCAAEPRVQHLPEAAHTLEFESDVGPYEHILRTWMGDVAV